MMSIGDRHFNNTVTSEDVQNEETNFQSILAAFKHYRSYSINRVNNTENYLNSIPSGHQEMLAKYREHLTNIRKCIDENYQIIRKITENTDRLFLNEKRTSSKMENGFGPIDQQSEPPEPIDPFKIIKVQITLKQFARDWSSEGADERKQCYKPIIDEITTFYNPSEIDISDVKILVPGAGLGRLAYEFARRGFYCEGNEFSLFMLLASYFVLNRCLIENQYTIYPWVHQSVNNLRREDQIKAITFPDVSPTQAPALGTFNMVAGDFLEVYVDPDYWDCVATCFFIDCANNVAAFVENIYKILKPGGIWVNLGPLLYHYSDVPNEGSIEPTFEDLILVIKAFGFKILKNETGIRTKYAHNPRSMHQSEYESVFFVCKKPLDDEEVVSVNIPNQNGQ